MALKCKNSAQHHERHITGLTLKLEGQTDGHKNMGIAMNTDLGWSQAVLDADFIRPLTIQNCRSHAKLRPWVTRKNICTRIFIIPSTCEASRFDSISNRTSDSGIDS